MFYFGALVEVNNGVLILITCNQLLKFCPLQQSCIFIGCSYSLLCFCSTTIKPTHNTWLGNIQKYEINKYSESYFSVFILQYVCVMQSPKFYYMLFNRFKSEYKKDKQ